MTAFSRPVTEIMNRLLTCGVFAAGLLVYNWDAAILLVGFWMEEVITFLFIAFKRGVVRKRTLASKKKISKGQQQALKVGPYVYTAFPAVHLIFIIIFVVIDSMNSPATAKLLSSIGGILLLNPAKIDAPVAHALLVMIVTFLATGIVQAAKDLTYGSDGRRSTLVSLDAQNRAALVLPHITIIFGGFAMLMFNASNWMAVGLVGGKCLCELLLIPAMNKEEEKSEERLEQNDI